MFHSILVTLMGLWQISIMILSKGLKTNQSINPRHGHNTIQYYPKQLSK